ncbi:LLM class flavin-dependent oxidoreductase [Amycolatopsis ultiminotia]|uniref:LLM class flavin-dependent oxidoreductase n=1 Tax=Amycolatopsis ultiminotia TaxID=543629 RepID=A0ABP6XID4_9PSEU
MNTTADNAPAPGAGPALGPVGALLPVSFTSTPSADRQRDAAVRLEQAGYDAVWTNEVIGKDAFTQLAVLLAATRRVVFGTSIANIWAREPQTAHAAAALLAQAYPGQFVLGLGVGYPEQAAGTGREFGRPLATLRDYVHRMTVPASPPAADAVYPRILGANGPKMLALAGEIADGALPAGLPPEGTAEARALLGPDKLLVVALSVVPDQDPERAREAARQQAAASFSRPPFAAALARLGYPEHEIADVSDRVVDATIGHGGPDAIAAKVGEHLAAGADHVSLMLPIGTDFGTGIEQLEQLSPALSDLS